MPTVVRDFASGAIHDKRPSTVQLRPVYRPNAAASKSTVRKAETANQSGAVGLFVESCDMLLLTFGTREPGRSLRPIRSPLPACSAELRVCWTCRSPAVENGADSPE